MELVPPVHENSLNDSNSAHQHAQRHWVGRIAIRPPYDLGSDAYSDLGGGLPSHRPAEDRPKYPTGLDRTVLFADAQQRQEVPATHIEIQRAYDLSLNRLTSAEFSNLSIANQHMVAVAVHDLLSTVMRRAVVLAIDGNFENPTFMQYEFQSQQEANEYAAQLSLLHHELMTREVIATTKSSYAALCAHSSQTKIRNLAKQVRDLTLHITDDHQVRVGHRKAQQR